MEHKANIGGRRVGRRGRTQMLLRPDRCGNYPRHMCGRYASFLPAEAIARIFGTVNPLPNLSPSWNVAPTQGATVVRRHPDTGGPTSIC